MPLAKGSSAGVVSKNIAELVRAGHPQAQAAAIAYKEAGKDRGADQAFDEEVDAGLVNALLALQLIGSGANDAITWDRASNRTYDADGYLHVTDSIISSAQINPYWGWEINKVDPRLALPPNIKFMMLRDPEALEAAVPSLHGKPLLDVHIGVTADQYLKEPICGAMMNPRWEAPNIIAEIVVWPSEASKDIEIGKKRDLSAQYRYRPLMEPGSHNGQPYDGRMLDIDFNAVALVPDGRVKGALVSDAGLAEDADMPSLIATIRPEIAAKLKDRLAQDATLADLSKTLKSMLDSGEITKDELMATSPNIGAPPMATKAKDAEPDFIKNMKAEDRKAFDDWMEGDRKRAHDEWEEEAEKKKKAEDKRAKDAAAEEEEKKKAEDKKAMDAKRARDAETEEEKIKREAEDKKARDAEAIQKEVEKLATSGGAMDQAISAALKVERSKQSALREAEAAVRPTIGNLALDENATAETVYQTALGMKGVDKKEIEKLPLDGLKVLWKHTQSAPSQRQATLAMDAGGDSLVGSILKDIKAPIKV